MPDHYSELSRVRLSPGTRLNGIFEIDHPIASGGMGEVYKGHTVQTGDAVAIKVLRPDMAENEAALALFRKEASALHNLHHDAIVRYFVFTVEPVLQRPYLAMEFVEGRSLSDLLREGPLTFEAARTLLLRVAAGLQAAHERGIIHRDVSPDNIIIPGGDVGRAKIIDFGIARSTNVNSGTIIGSGFAGKYNYVSPEQLGLYGGDVTGRSDIYSLALVLVEALTGQPIDMGGSQAEIVEKRRKVPDLKHIDLRIQALLERMLQPNPADRPLSMAEVASWPLDARGARGRRDLDPSGHRLGRRAEPERRRGMAGRLAVVGVLGMLVLGGGGAGLYLLQQPERPLPAPAPPALGQPPTARLDPSPPSAPPAPQLQTTPAPAPQTPALQTTPAPRPLAPLPTTPAPAPQTPQLQTTPAPTLQTPPPQLQATPVSPVAPPQATLAPARPSPQAQTAPAAPSSSARPEARPAPAPPVLTAPPPPVVTTAPPPPTLTAPPSRPEPGGVVAALPAPPPPPPPRPVDPAPLGRTDVIARFINEFEGGECVFVAPIAVSETAASIEGYGASAAPFQVLDDAFKRAHGFEADIGVRQVTAAQCPAVTFLSRMRSGRGTAPRLAIKEANLRSGQALSGTVEAGGRRTELLLVDDDGDVHNLSAMLRGGEPRTFGVQLTLSGGGSQPQLLLAIASTVPLEALRGTQPVPAGQLFPRLLEEAARTGQALGVASKYFKLQQ